MVRKFPITVLFTAIISSSLFPQIVLAETTEAAVDEEPVITPYANLRYRLENVDQLGVPLHQQSRAVIWGR